MLYADGIEEDSVNSCQQDERGRWVCADEQESVGAVPFWQSVDHWNFAESVPYSSSPWGSFPKGRAYASPRESTCTECVGTPVGFDAGISSTAKWAGAAALAAGVVGIAYFLTRK
jgi:hypothetical protein